MDQEYEKIKQEFERVRVVIGELADVLDQEFPQYVVEEDKTLQYKQMIFSNKGESNDSNLNREHDSDENGQMPGP